MVVDFPAPLGPGSRGFAFLHLEADIVHGHVAAISLRQVCTSIMVCVSSYFSACPIFFGKHALYCMESPMGICKQSIKVVCLSCVFPFECGGLCEL